jgi:serine protease inhibitor
MNTWLNPFAKYRTRDQQFTGKTVRDVPMMSLSEESFEYYENTEFQVISLPYTNGTSMVVVLPKSKKNIPSFDFKSFKSLCDDLKYECCNVQLPKFEQETELNLIPFFKQNGMTQMFDYMHADDMIPRHDEQKITLIKQKTKIVVNEEGTEASSATVISGICVQCARFPPQKIYNFIADHSFSYHIIHYSGLMLFSGVYQ